MRPYIGDIMRLKRPKKNKTGATAFRRTDEEANKIQQKANIYTEGNLSEYILYACLNFVPSKDDFEKEKPKRKGKKK